MKNKDLAIQMLSKIQSDSDTSRYASEQIEAVKAFINKML